MTLPTPVPGLVIRYSYLWRSDYLQGLEESSKDRPCAVILVAQTTDEDRVVTVLPIAHSPPTNANEALEIPATVKRRLRLDGERSWIVCGEANRFVWPGPDLRLVAGRDAPSVAYGVLPPRFFGILKARFLDVARARRARLVSRDE